MSPPPPSTVSLLQNFLPFFFLLSIVKLTAEEQLCNSSTVCKRSNVTISHPFWRLDDSGEEEEKGPICGYPNFGINCSNADPEYPLITINGHDYLVKNISYPEQSITLVDSQLISPNNACPWKLNQSLVLDETAPFSYISHIDLNLTFFSNCARPPLGAIPNLHSIGCDSYLFVGPVDPYWIGNCTEKMETAVMITDEIDSPDYDWNASVGKAMEEGFMLDWAKCAHCEKYNALCGHDCSANQTHKKQGTM